MDEKKELRNINTAVFISVGSAVYTLAIAIINPILPNIYLDPSSMIQESIIVLLLAFGLYKKSRICAVILFALILLEFILLISDNEPFGFMLVMSLFIFKGLVSVFKYHKYKKEIAKTEITQITTETTETYNPIQYANDDKTKNTQNYIYLKPSSIVKTILIFFAVIIFIGAIALTFEESNTTPFKQRIIEEINKTNNDLPMMIDDDTRLDSVSEGPGDNITYSFTLVNYLKEDLDADVLKELMKPILIEFVNSGEVDELKYNNYTFTYSYFDKDNVYICDVIVTPEDYNKNI